MSVGRIGKRMVTVVAVSFGMILVGAAAPFDHVAAIQELSREDAEVGARLYGLHCATCHGKDGTLALNPLARRFALDPLKYGSDPYALWKTVSYGNGLMFRWDGVLSEQQRYQIVHHLREDILKVANKSQYFVVDEAYYEGINERAEVDAAREQAGAQQVVVGEGMIDGSGGTRMQYGSLLQHGVVFGTIANKDAAVIEEMTERALIVSLGELNVCYDLARLSVSGVWSGKLVDTVDTHHTSYKGSRPMMPSGALHYKNVDRVGWVGDEPRFKGLYRHGDQVVLEYMVGNRRILEMPFAVPGTTTFARYFQVGPGEVPLVCVVGRGKEDGLSNKVTASHSDIVLQERGGEDRLSIAASSDFQTCTVWLSTGDEPRVPADLAPIRVDALMSGGPRRWAETVETPVVLGEDVEGYAADELTAPLANPYGSWMRLTALDFFSDGRLAVATLSGDVWIVSPKPEDANTLLWSRFAAGLYEPLGLKIVDDTVYVRGRDRITRLHDLNGDGEADHYESFYEDDHEIGGGYHAFKYDLQTDASGYLYYSQSGYKSPLDGVVMRVSADGTHGQPVAADLRNPNGMGAGGPNGWVTIADNPSGVAIYNGFSLVREGSRYGFEQERNTPMLVVLPARVDSSSGGQCWADLERWGPLSGSIIHVSYSRSAVFYCRAQDLEPYPNGFAMRLPFDLKAGAMRPRVSPVDGQVYVACKKGWDSIARVDGVIYRFRKTGMSSHLIQDVAATANGLRLTFPCDLDAGSIDAKQFTIVREPDKPTNDEGLKVLPVGDIRLTNARTLEVDIPGIEKETLKYRTEIRAGGETIVHVNPAISLTVKLAAVDGTVIEQTVYATINALP